MANLLMNFLTLCKQQLSSWNHYSEVSYEHVPKTFGVSTRLLFQTISRPYCGNSGQDKKKTELSLEMPLRVYTVVPSDA